MVNLDYEKVIETYDKYLKDVESRINKFKKVYIPIIITIAFASALSSFIIGAIGLLISLICIGLIVMILTRIEEAKCKIFIYDEIKRDYRLDNMRKIFNTNK